jgi:hypothetical protein
MTVSLWPFKIKNPAASNVRLACSRVFSLHYAAGISGEEK